MDPKSIILLICFFSYVYVAEDSNDEDDEHDFSHPKRYDGYTVLRLIPQSEDDLIFIHGLKVNEMLDFWANARVINVSVDVMVPPFILKEFKYVLDENNINYTVFIQDVQRVVDEEKKYVSTPEESSRQKRSLFSFFRKYHKSKVIYWYLEQLYFQYPSLVEYFDVEMTYNNKDIKLFQITFDKTRTKPVIWIDGGIHAREWISPATVLYFIYKLLTGFQKNREIQKLVRSYDWYFMPLVNPDGYDYTFKKDRFWRKNRSKSSEHSDGVDLNRNFRYGWNDSSTTTPQMNDPNSEDYIGPFAFSEKETQAMSKVLHYVRKRLKLYISLHSYGQYILFPWGCKRRKVKEYYLLKNIGLRAAKKINSFSGTVYKSDSIFNALYPAPGNSIDWVYGELGIKPSFTIELRDKGKQGFELHPSEIIHVGEETWLGIQSMISDVI